MFERMKKALAGLSAIAKIYTPADVQSALLAYGEEIDRLRAEVDELRSRIIDLEGK